MSEKLHLKEWHDIMENRRIHFLVENSMRRSIPPPYASQKPLSLAYKIGNRGNS